MLRNGATALDVMMVSMSDFSNNTAEAQSSSQPNSHPLSLKMVLARLEVPKTW